MEVQPMADRVLVKRAGKQTKTPGGILIPETAQDKLGEGEVVAVGPGRMHRQFNLDISRIPPEDVPQAIVTFQARIAEMKPEPLSVQVGDRVFYSINAGTPLEVAGVPHVMLREDDIIAIVAPDADVSMVGPNLG